MHEENHKEFRIKCIPCFDFQTEIIQFETEICGRITREVACFKDEAIRKFLISIGWTPPQQNLDQPTNKV